MRAKGLMGPASRIVRARSTRSAALMAIAGTVGFAVAHAADAQQDDSAESHHVAEQPLMFELAAFGALAVGGNFRLENTGANGTGTSDSIGLADHGAFALAADLRADEATQYELFYAREATHLSGNAIVPRMGVTIEYLHLGGTLLLDVAPSVKPYVVGGLGATRLTPDAQGSTDTRFSASLGLGLRLPVTRHFSVRLEGRGFVTLVNPDTSIFCRSDQAGLLCQIHGRGQAFLQGQFLAGAAFAF